MTPSAPSRTTTADFPRPSASLLHPPSRRVVLKILDGKCKMAGEEKMVMAQLYDAVRGCEGLLLGAAAHALIAQARDGMDAELRELVYEKRVLAETMISRPVMKGFKALIREQGLFDGLDVAYRDD